MTLLEQLLSELPKNEEVLLTELVERAARDKPQWLSILNSTNPPTQHDKAEVMREIVKHGGFQPSNFDKIIQVFPS